jgi:hypothetical protein
MATPTSGADVWLTINGKPLRFQANDENLHVHASEKERNLLKITPNAPAELEIFIDGEVLDTAVYGYWYWRPEKYAGLYELEVRAPNQETRIARVRVQPEKLTQERYEAMLTDINAVVLDLLFRLNSPAGEKAIAEQSMQAPSPLREYRQIAMILQELKDVMAHIRRSPYQVLDEQYEKKLLHEVQRFSHQTMPLPGPVQVISDHIAPIAGLAHLPEIWHVPRRTLTYDVHENRLLKHFIKHQLMTKLTLLKERAENEIKRREPIRAMKISRGWPDDETPEILKLAEVVTECRDMTQWCVAWCSDPFLKTVNPVAISSKATQVLLKNPFYSRFYRLYLRFQQELKISLDTERYLTILALRKIWDLYEIWSIFQITHMVVAELLNASYTFASSSLFYEVEKDCFQFEVRKHVASIILTKGDIHVEIKYEPIYSSHQSTNNSSTLVSKQRSGKYFTPDLAIEVYQRQIPIHVIIFDAKYSWQREPDGSHVPHDNDIDKMHTYYDMICYKLYNASHSRYRLQNIVSSAYILYPGDLLYREPGNLIGALPLVPKMLQSNRAKVEQALKGILRLAHLP